MLPPDLPLYCDIIVFCRKWFQPFSSSGLWRITEISLCKPRGNIWLLLGDKCPSWGTWESQNSMVMSTKPSSSMLGHQAKQSNIEIPVLICCLLCHFWAENKLGCLQIKDVIWNLPKWVLTGDGSLSSILHITNRCICCLFTFNLGDGSVSSNRGTEIFMTVLRRIFWRVLRYEITWSNPAFSNWTYSSGQVVLSLQD